VSHGPWAFGWTQVRTLLGFGITTVIAIAGFRTFDNWRREKLEEKRIEIAFDALALAYEAKYVFGNIRSSMSCGYEYKDMPKRPGENDQEWGRRGASYAV
jgi:hypothetical protein